MVKERFCSYELSKLLKEKGFNIPCVKFYHSDNRKCGGYTMPPINWNKGNYISKPTHQMVIDWLRVKNVFLFIMPAVTGQQFVYVVGKYESEIFDDYSECVEKALNHCVKMLP